MLAQAGHLERDLNLVAGVRRAGAFAQVDADEILPQGVDLGGALQLAEGRVVGLLVVGAAVPLEGAAWLLEHLLGGARHVEHQPPVLLGILGQGQQLLVDGDEPLAIARIGVERGQVGQGVGLFGIDLEHAFEGQHRLVRIGQAFAAQPADFQPARDAFLGLGGQGEMALGDRHHTRPVLDRLGHAAQSRVGRDVGRIHLVDDLLQGDNRLGRLLEILLEDAGAFEREGGRVGGGRGDGDSALQEAGQRRVVAHVRGDRRQRLQGLAVGGLDLEQGFPRVLGAARLPELAAGEPGQAAQGLDLRRGIAGLGLDLEVEDVGQFLGTADFLVGHQQGVEGLLVAGHVLDELLPIGNGLGEVADGILQDPGDALDDLQLVAGGGGVAQVVFEHLDQPGLVPRLLEDGFQPQEGVGVARDEFQDLRGGERGGGKIRELLHVDVEHAAKQADLLGLAFGVLNLALQQRGQVRPALVLLVGLDDVAQGHRLARIDAQDLQVDRGRVVDVVQLLGVQAGQTVQDVDLHLGELGAFGFVDQERHHLVPLLGLLQDALLRLARALVPRRDFPHAAPHGERALQIAELAFRQHRDFFQSRQQLVDGAALLAVVLGGELE